MKTLSYVTWLVAAFGLLFCGCEKSPSPIGNTLSEQNGQSIPTRASALKTAETIPSPLVTLDVGGSALELWPFTGVDFSGTAQDPINLIFAGQTDPRALRAALLFLDGNRTAFGFPNAFPFNLTWQDAIGGVQTAFANPEGWAGSAIQLALGPYDPVRFHLRLFEVGDFALGGAHFEVLIPGTTDHQVISWELAEQLIVADFARSNLLAAAPQSSDPLNPSPFKEIPAIIYLAFWGITQFYQGVASLAMPAAQSGVAYWAHVGGFATGLLLVWLFARRPRAFVRRYDDEFAPW